VLLASFQAAFNQAMDKLRKKVAAAPKTLKPEDEGGKKI